jgi:hypothetical protein
MAPAASEKPVAKPQTIHPEITPPDGFCFQNLDIGTSHHNLTFI